MLSREVADQASSAPLSVPAVTCMSKIGRLSIVLGAQLELSMCTKVAQPLLQGLIPIL